MNPMPYRDRTRQAAYQNEWLKRRRREWLAANGPCRECGSWHELEVDHLDPKQKASHRIWGWSRARRETELAKCQPLCGECHKAKTYEQRHAGKERDGLDTKPKCRCRVCKLRRAIRKRIERRGIFNALREIVKLHASCTLPLQNGGETVTSVE